jgi:hypothetical protein
MVCFRFPSAFYHYRRRFSRAESGENCYADHICAVKHIHRTAEKCICVQCRQRLRVGDNCSWTANGDTQWGGGCQPWLAEVRADRLAMHVDT